MYSGLRWTKISWTTTIPYNGNIYGIELNSEGYSRGFVFEWSGLLSKMECEVKVCDYFDDVLWSGKGEIYDDSVIGQPPRIVVKKHAEVNL